MHALVFLMLAGADGADVDALLARAEQAYAQLEYEAARDIVLDVVAAGTASDAQLRRAHMLGGEVERILGHDVDARMHFLWVLQREPDARLPEGRPPKIGAFFELVRSEVKGAAAAAPPAAPPPAAAPALPAPPGPPPAAAAPPPAPLPTSAYVAAGAGAVAVGAVALALVGEAMFANPATPWGERSGGLAIALLGWTAAAVSSATAGVALVRWGTAP